jgi:hypothetical protein
MERAIGDRFNHYNSTLEVVELKDKICNNCFYYESNCFKVRGVRGSCSAKYRSDNRGVYFKEIK